MTDSQNAFGSAEHAQDRSAREASPIGRPPGAAERQLSCKSRHELARVAITLGRAVRDERRRRHLSMRDLALRGGVGLATVHAAETGVVCSLETYVRLAEALRIRADFELTDPRRRDPLTRRAQDPVHSAMGEAEAAHLRALGVEVGIDEPFQHYQFAGRADVVAWSAHRAALLHIENRTRFPDIQDSFGSFNAKRRYLGAEIAAAAGIARWRSETHVIAALWSAEVLREIRAHHASFGSVCPDPPKAFDAWWRGEPPSTGRYSILLVFDPIEGRRLDRARWVGLAELPGLRPRYRGYAEAVAAIEAPPSGA